MLIVRYLTWLTQQELTFIAVVHVYGTVVLLPHAWSLIYYVGGEVTRRINDASNQVTQNDRDGRYREADGCFYFCPIQLRN